MPNFVVTRRRLVVVVVSSLLAAAAVFALTPQGRTSHRAADSLQSLLDRAGIDLPFDPLLAAASCPYERGAVKEGSDVDRFKVSTKVVSTSISYLRGRAKPGSYPQAHRLGGAELHTYQIRAFLTQYKVESDGDIHLVLKDSAGRSMIAEIPFGSCVPAASRWRSAIASARSRFTNALRTSSSWRYLHKAVTVRGIGYFDPLHGQTGAAKNGIELHPVVAVSFPTG